MICQETRAITSIGCNITGKGKQTWSDTFLVMSDVLSGVCNFMVIYVCQNGLRLCENGVIEMFFPPMWPKMQKVE